MIASTGNHQTSVKARYILSFVGYKHLCRIFSPFKNVKATLNSETVQKPPQAEACWPLA